MRYLRNIFYIFIFSAIISSCEDIMELDTKDLESKMVVYSYLTNEDSVVVVVSSSYSIFGDNKTPRDSIKPQVMVSINDSDYQKMTRDDSYNTYSIAFPTHIGPILTDPYAKTFLYKYTPQSGDKLSFIIEDLFTGTTLTAETIIPAKPQFEIEVSRIDTVYYDSTPPLRNMKDYYSLTLKCTIHNIDQENNFYIIDYVDYHEHKSFKNIYSSDPIFEDDGFSGIGYSDAYFNDNYFSDSDYTFEFTIDNRDNSRVEMEDGIYTIVLGSVRLIQLSEEMYLYFKSTYNALRSYNDIFAQPLKLYTNIKGDGYGFVGGAYHSYSDTLKYILKCKK